MKIKTFKRFHQVVNDEGYTIAQFISKSAAQAFNAQRGFYPTADAIKWAETSKIGYSTRKIKIYP